MLYRKEFEEWFKENCEASQSPDYLQTLLRIGRMVNMGIDMCAVGMMRIWLDLVREG